MPKSPVDLRSDTVTRPTPAMRKAMYEAEVGDDVLSEDPTVRALEAFGAQILGKEASLLVPSGTFGNQCALFTHCERGSEVVLSEDSHIVQHEAGASAVIAGVQLRTIPRRLAGDGTLTWAEVLPRLRLTSDVHFPATGLIEEENATSGGDVAALTVMDEIAAGARSAGIPVHLDGARIFNAAVCLGVEAREIAARADSVMVCLSKGLCAPIGSLLAGTREFVGLARRRRKAMGGGMRQAGVIAAAGLVALREMVSRLPEDHATARRLGEAFLATGAVEVRPWPPRINMVFVRFRPPAGERENEALVASLARRGVLTYPPDGGWVRFVTHHDAAAQQIEAACRAVPAAVEEALRP
jgi:threonine aldolase